MAADEVVRKSENVFYFPSYEIITSPAAGNRYYDDDLRSITELGVNHVMRVFFRSCCQLPDDQESASVAQHAIDGLVKDMENVCDEDMIAQAVQGTATTARGASTSPASLPTLFSLLPTGIESTTA